MSEIKKLIIFAPYKCDCCKTISMQGVLNTKKSVLPEKIERICFDHRCNYPELKTHILMW